VDILTRSRFLDYPQPQLRSVKGAMPCKRPLLKLPTRSAGRPGSATASGTRHHNGEARRVLCVFALKTPLFLQGTSVRHALGRVLSASQTSFNSPSQPPMRPRMFQPTTTTSYCPFSQSTLTIQHPSSSELKRLGGHSQPSMRDAAKAFQISNFFSYTAPAE